MTGARPRENLELVRSVVVEWERGDYRSADWADPDIEVVVADGPFEGRHFRGRAAMAANERDFLDAWEGYRLEAEEYRELAGDRVLVLVRHSGRGRSSGLDLAEMGARGAVLFQVDGGSVTRLLLYWDRDGALRDLGEPDIGEIVAAGARAYTESGPAALAETWHDDIVYEEDPRFPGSGTFSGRAAVLERFREYEEQMGAGAVAIDRVEQLPAGNVLIWRHSGTTPGSGVPFEHRWGWVVHLRDGKAVHIRAYLDPDEAVRAASSLAPDA